MRAFTTLLTCIFLTSSAYADLADRSTDYQPGEEKSGFVLLPPQSYMPQNSASVSNVLFIDFCLDGGCTFTPGEDDARTDTSSVLQNSCANTTSTLSAYEHTGAIPAIMDCVRELYKPYNVVVTDQRPPDNTFYHRAVVAGKGTEIGCQGALGIAPANFNCAPRDNAISFTFGNMRTENDIDDICWTIAQESAHSYGLLNHVGDPTDPMTYRLDWHGRKYFRNKAMPCSESPYDPIDVRPCICTGTSQNSHAMLNNVFGPGTLPPGPAANIELPQDGATVGDGFQIFATATDPRQVARVDFYINDWQYGSAPGFPYAQRGNAYAFKTPDLPDGYQKITVKAYTDIGSEGVAEEVTVLKGSPCTSADQCFEGQDCREGGCYWPAPTNKVGDSCAIDQECETLKCAEFDGERRCAQECTVGVTGQCPDDFECRATGGSDGVCWGGGSGGGGCSATSGLPILAGIMLLLGLASLRRSRQH